MSVDEASFDRLLDACRARPGCSDALIAVLRAARSRYDRSRLVRLVGLQRPDERVSSTVRLRVADLLEGFNAPAQAARWRDPRPRSLRPVRCADDPGGGPASTLRAT